MSTLKEVHGRSRRNDGRSLFCVIESGDNYSHTALEDLSELTRAWVTSLGHTVRGWPESVHEVLYGAGAARRWVREDDAGQRHTFALVEFVDFDVLFAVSSRRQRNLIGQLTENLATNLLLELLATEGAAGGRLYGLLGAVHSSRLLRQGVPGAHVIDACREWDVVLSCKDIYVDPLIDPSPYAALIALAQNAEGATHLIRNSSAHRISAHRSGICKFPRAVTHPVVAVHPETKVMSWDRSVAEAVRDTVALLRNGTSWGAAAEIVGHRIPSHRLRAEPDVGTNNARVKLRTRAKRNTERRRAGLSEVPLKLLPDGSPNPEYRPETILHQRQPGAGLRMLFLGGAGLVGDSLADALAQQALGGLHPNDTTLELLATGRFRRLVIDQDSSNRTVKNYRYIEYQLPPYEGTDDDPTWVLTRDDVEFLKAMRNGPPGTGSSGTLPLIAFFHVGITTALHTTDGILTRDAAGANRVVLTDHDGTAHTGVVAWTTGIGTDGRVYRIWFGRDASRRDTRRSLCLALVEAEPMHQSLLDAINAAIHKHPEAATFEVREARGRPEEVALRAATGRHAAALEKFLGCGEALASTGLSPAMRAMLEKQAADAETQLAAAEEALAAAETALTTYIDDNIPLGDLIDVLAALQLPLPLDPAVARRIQSRLRDLIRDAQLTIDPDTQTLRWTATLELRSNTGLVLHLPLAGEVPNNAKDPWLGGPPGTFWRQRCTVTEAMGLHGLTTDPTKSTLWRGHIERRFLIEAKRQGVQWKGPNAVNLFVRSPHPDVIRAGFAILYGETHDDLPPAVVDEVQRVFFGSGTDLPHPRACNWRTGSHKAKHVATLIALLNKPGAGAT
jgi:hypothetical protein